MSLTVEESNFDSVHPPAGLASELAKSKARLMGLRFITQLQLHILYPSNASNIISESFDTTLIVCLLRNMISHESAPVTGWDIYHSHVILVQVQILLELNGISIKIEDMYYRNQLVHSKDGKLSPTDVIQYWGDLEGAIGRLDGNNLLMEAQSAKHIVLDKSLTDILTKLGINENNIEEHREMLDNLQVAVEKQTIIKEQHENRIQKLNDSLQKGVGEAQKQAAELSDHKESIDNCTEETGECKKEIQKIQNAIKRIQDKVTDKQDQVDNLAHLLVRLECKYNKQLKEIDGQLVKHDEQMAKHDEQIATSAKDINDMKKKQFVTGDTSGDTKALIDEDLREDTFVITKVVSDGLLLLKHAGTGKSRTGRHVLNMFCTGDTSYKCIKLNTLEKWEDMVSREDNVVVLLDDIFGETKCIYNKKKDTPTLDKVHAYV